LNNLFKNGDAILVAVEENLETIGQLFVLSVRLEAETLDVHDFVSERLKADFLQELSVDKLVVVANADFPLKARLNLVL
jgi:hypothetical protein